MSPSQPSKLDAYLATRGLRGKRVIRPEVDELVDILASELCGTARRRLAEAGAFHLALSGGDTPQVLYQRLMIDPTYRNFPWSATHLWVVDERCVEFDDDRSNYKLLREMIVDHSGIPEAQVHPMPALDAVGDHRYEDELRAALARPGCGGRLDFVLLGMGGDGHTASLFPNSPALTEGARWVVFNDGPTVTEPRPRMTMTYPLINEARNIAILVTGEAKHAALQHVSLAADAGGDAARFPITGIEPAHEDTRITWYLDHPAAMGPTVSLDPQPDG